MATFNKSGQWSLSGDEESLLFKTNEKKSSGKTELLKREEIDPNSEEAKQYFQNLAKAILAGVPKQPTNETLFGRLVPSEEQVVAAEKDWENKIGGFYEEAKKPIESVNKSSEWGNCKSFKDQLSEEELAEYRKEENAFNKANK